MDEKTAMQKQRIAVVGSGPAGYAAALYAAGRGHAVTLVERGAPGGVCLHTGCVPTRAYLEAIRRGEAYAALTGEPAALPDAKALRRQAETVMEELAYGIRFMMRKRRIRFLEGTAAFSGPGTLSVLRPDGVSEAVPFDRVLVATGSRPRSIALSSGVTVRSVDELLTLKDLPQRITVVGGGVLGVELSVILASLGVAVRLQETRQRILPDWDEDVSAGLTFDLQKRGVTVAAGETDIPPGEAVLCLGREPVLPAIGWPELAEALAGHLHTERLGVYLAGDCLGVGGDAAAAIQTGRSAVTAMERGEPLPAPGGSHAQCVFTPLEAAMVGLTEAAAKQEGLDCVSASVPLSTTAAGKLTGADNGFVKAVMERASRRLLGFHVLAPCASEGIMAGALLVQGRYTADQAAALFFPHPTLCESMRDAAVALLERYG